MFNWMAMNCSVGRLLDSELCGGGGGGRSRRPLISLALPGDRGKHQTQQASNFAALYDPHIKDERRFLSGSSEWTSIASKGHVHFYNLLLV